MKALKIAGAAAGAVILLLVLLVTVGVPTGFLTSVIEDRAERATGYRLTIDGGAKVSLWPSLNITLTDLTLQNPKDRDGLNRLTIASVTADMTLSSVWSGHPEVSELIVNKPVLYKPLLRERERDRTAQPASAAASETDNVSIEHIKLVDGTIVASNARDRVETRIEAINAGVTIDPDRKVKVAGTARAAGNPIKFDLNATAPPLERQNMPIELSLDAPGLLHGPLSARAEVRLNGAVVMINDLSGSLGDGAFNGWASVDVASKPLVKVDLDFQRLNLATAASTAAGTRTWSDAPIDLIRLNYVDAQIKLSAAEATIDQARFAPAEIDATLAAGVLKASFPNLGTYGGQSSGELIVDASNGNPVYAMHCDLVGVRALPLLSGIADFDKIDGKMQAKVAARSTGASERAIMSNLSGNAFLNFQDGQIRGLNVAQMIRSLTASPLSGWQEQQEQATDLSQLSASFKIDRGQASTADLNLVGPLIKVTGTGTIDLGTKMLGFRVEPKLVLTTQGQGRTSDPVGFGVPVMIDGPWEQPRIYPDMAGIFDNPDAAYAKLKEMGKGLFNGSNAGALGGLLNGLSGLTGSSSNSAGALGGGTSSDSLGGLGQTLGGLIQQGLGGARNRGIPGTGDPAAPQQPVVPPPAAAQNDGGQPASPDSQPMNDVLRQLFNRSQN